MKKTLGRLAAAALAVGLLTTGAGALTTDELATILKNEYAGSVPQRVWEQSTVEGMLEALGDPFSRYYDPTEYAAFRSALGGGDAQGPTATVRVDGEVGTVAIRLFGEDTYDAMVTGIAQSPNVRHWVVDLRGNRGGALRAAADAMSVFAGGGEQMFLRDKAGKLYSAKSQHSKVTMYPVVVLVDETTASAGELYAAGIRDRQRGVIIGSRTYGKGVAQSAFDATHETYGAAFSDGSALLLTTEKAFSENLLSPNGMGVLPHLAVAADMARPVAELLGNQGPADSAGYLRLHLARWRWYIHTGTADKAALTALLEALPPQAELYAGAGGNVWQQTTAAGTAARLGLTGYVARCFPDVADSPYQDAINALKTYGVVKGDQNGNYNPTQGLDRASLCALLAQAMNYPPSTATPAFADTPADAWYTPYVTTLSAMGIVNGYDDGLFHPNDLIDHQQFMTILSRIVADLNATSYGAWQVGPSEAELAGGSFDAYDDWAVKGAWLLDGTWHKDAKDIDPKATTTREEAAYDLWSALSTMGLLPG